MIHSDPSVGITLSTLPLDHFVPVFFTLVFVVWFIYTLISAYHWLRYSDNVLVGLTAIGAHVGISSLLAIYAVSGLH